MANDSSPPELGPDDIARHEFTHSFRGFDQIEVKAFLNSVASTHRSLLRRMTDLQRELADARAEAGAKPQPREDGAKVVAMLGEETARIVDAAREAAGEMQRRAEEDATRLRSEAAELMANHRRQAEELLEQATTAAEERRRETDAACGAAIEEARERGREMVEEARQHRERVVSDLAARRKSLRRQYEQLKVVRDQMLGQLESSQGRVSAAIADVRKAITDLKPADLADVEVDDDDIADATTEASGDRDPAADDVGEDRIFSRNRIRTPASVPSAAVETAVTENAVSEGAGETTAGVDQIFAKLRADVEPEAEAEPEPAAAADAAPEPAMGAEPEADPDLLIDLTQQSGGEEAPIPESAAAAAAESVDADAAVEPAAAAEADEEADAVTETDLDPLAALFVERDRLLAGIEESLLSRAKRALADDQNAVLDRLRRVRGTVSTERVLADDTGADEFVAATESDLAAAYSAGLAAAGGTGGVPDISRQIGRDLADLVLGPLRERLGQLIDQIGDPDDIATQLRARYREFRTTSLGDLARHGAALAYARGRFDSIADGTQVVWLRDPRAPGSPDCEDNVLAGRLIKGASFPSGQAVSPAYPGCRCLVVAAAIAPVPV